MYLGIFRAQKFNLLPKMPFHSNFGLGLTLGVRKVCEEASFAIYIPLMVLQSRSAPRERYFIRPFRQECSPLLLRWSDGARRSNESEREEGRYGASRNYFHAAAVV